MAFLFLIASILLVLSKDRFPLIMRLWFYHATLYWIVNSVVVIIYGHYMNPKLINMWATTISLQAGLSVIAVIYAQRWRQKSEELDEI